MKIDKVKIQHLGRLAKLNFSEPEMKKMMHDLEEILQFVNKLSEIDTTNILPLTHIHDEINIYRDDLPRNSNFKTPILENAPSQNSDYIKVPKVLGNTNKF